jgi:hypothetical protein
MIAVAILGLAPQVLGGITACEIDHYWTKVRDAPLAEAMSLELTTDRREYVVGEAVGFGVVLRNISSRRLEGNFGIIAPASPLVRIDYRRNGVMVDTIDRATIDPHGMVGLSGHLDPGRSVEGTRFRAVDGGRNDLLLAEPGSYTFRATFCEPSLDLNSVVVSNEITLEVRPALMVKRQRGRLIPTKSRLWVNGSRRIVDWAKMCGSGRCSSSSVTRTASGAARYGAASWVSPPTLAPARRTRTDSNGFERPRENG